MILFACLLLQICRPPLNPFVVEHQTLFDGWTRTVGTSTKESYNLHVDYVDNRNVSYDYFSSEGSVVFTNTHVTIAPILIKYRHTVNLNKGNYIVHQDSNEYEVCVELGKVTFYVEKEVAHFVSTKADWSYVIDIQLWGDIDDDGCINGSDLGILFGEWGLPGVADFNKDGITDGQDLSAILSNWNSC